jgi:hypothetical protein
MRDWQKAAPQWIARIHAENPEATPAELRKALRASASAFHGGTSWGQKVWSKHCRTYLARMSGRGDFRADGKETVWQADIVFPWRGESTAPGYSSPYPAEERANYRNRVEGDAVIERVHIMPRQDGGEDICLPHVCRECERERTWSAGQVRGVKR